jgi:hypothetical protein
MTDPNLSDSKIINFLFCIIFCIVFILHSLSPDFLSSNLKLNNKHNKRTFFHKFLLIIIVIYLEFHFLMFSQFILLSYHL